MIAEIIGYVFLAAVVGFIGWKIHLKIAEKVKEIRAKDD